MLILPAALVQNVVVSFETGIDITQQDRAAYNERVSLIAE